VREIVMAAVAQNGMALAFASEEMQVGRRRRPRRRRRHSLNEQQLCAAKQNDKHTSVSFSICLSKLHRAATLLFFSPQKLVSVSGISSGWHIFFGARSSRRCCVRQGDYDVALEAAAQNGLSLQFAWGHLRANEYVAEAAMAQVKHAGFLTGKKLCDAISGTSCKTRGGSALARAAHPLWLLQLLPQILVAT
jgi:hypothetical protein